MIDWFIDLIRYDEIRLKRKREWISFSFRDWRAFLFLSADIDAVPNDGYNTKLINKLIFYYYILLQASSLLSSKSLNRCKWQTSNERRNDDDDDDENKLKS